MSYKDKEVIGARLQVMNFLTELTEFKKSRKKETI